MNSYEYIKKILLAQILVVMCIVIDFISPDINKIIPHEFEILGFAVLLGVTIGNLITLVSNKKR